MIGQMAIAIALLGFNDLGCSVTPTFLFRNRFYLQLSPHCPKMNKKSIWEVEKKFKIFVHGTWNLQHPPRATPWAFEFLENFCSNSPLTGPKSCSNAPTPGQLPDYCFNFSVVVSIMLLKLCM